MYSSATLHDHRIFRVILQAMSHPGKIYALPIEDPDEPAAAQLLGCLMDNETTFAVIGAPELETILSRRTGALPVSCEQADFIVACNGATSGETTAFKRGSLEYPHTSATILYLVETLDNAGDDITLSGPGVDQTVRLGITGVHPGELLLLKEINHEFPLGVDAIFLDQSGRITCIPRSSHMRLS